MKNSLVSIVMPVYNGDRYIRQAIESVLAQEYPHWELVIVDDGSVDDTSKIIGEFEDSRIHYIYQQNRGQAAALNRGLEASSGDYITTLDADDWLPQGSLVARVDHLDCYSEFGVVYGDGYYCDESGKELFRFSQHMPAGNVGDVYDALIVSPFYGTGASVMVRRDVLEKHQLRYDEEIVWCQDWDFYIRLAEKASFGYVEALTIWYRLHGGGMTLAMPRGSRLESLIRLRLKVLESPRFDSASFEQKTAFFYDFLVRDLQGRSKDREEVIAGDRFNSLPQSTQARLLRQMAISCILARDDASISKRWLSASWKKAPFDPKTGITLVLSGINVSLARTVMQSWQRNKSQGEAVSPLEIAMASEKS